MSVFLAFLLFSVQLLVNLSLTTTVTDVAHEGARRVAAAGTDQTDPLAVARAQEDAERHMRQLLGRVGDRAEIDWSRSTTDDVVVGVRVESPRFLLPSLQASLGFDHIDRVVRVRREQPR